MDIVCIMMGDLNKYDNKMKLYIQFLQELIHPISIPRRLRRFGR